MNDVTNDRQGQLPETFCRRLQEIVGPDRFAACMQTFSAELPCAFRVNTLKANVADVMTELHGCGIVTAPLEWCSYAFTVAHADRGRLIESPLFSSGSIYLQNASSMLAPWGLDPQPGETVLDLAAAPGGKASQIAALMKNLGVLSVVEPIRNRFFKLRSTLDLCGVTNAKFYLTDGRTVGRKVPERFDRILLDAPCSSESRFRIGEPETWAHWSERKIAEQSRKQKGLLYSAVQALRPGGRLIYATCSFAPEENEAVVDQVLRRAGASVDVVPFTLPIPNTMDGIASWRDRQFDSRVRFAQRIIPAGPYDGFFICSLTKPTDRND